MLNSTEMLRTWNSWPVGDIPKWQIFQVLPILLKSVTDIKKVRFVSEDSYWLFTSHKFYLFGHKLSCLINSYHYKWKITIKLWPKMKSKYSSIWNTQSQLLIIQVYIQILHKYKDNPWIKLILTDGYKMRLQMDTDMTKKIL